MCSGRAKKNERGNEKWKNGMTMFGLQKMKMN